MLTFTHGAPDEMQVWIALGIATYAVVFTLVVISAAVCGVLARQTQPDERNAANAHGESPSSAPALPRAVSTDSCPSESVGTAA